MLNFLDVCLVVWKRKLYGFFELYTFLRRGVYVNRCSKCGCNVFIKNKTVCTVFGFGVFLLWDIKACHYHCTQGDWCESISVDIIQRTDVYIRNPHDEIF